MKHLILICTIFEALPLIRPGAEWNLRGRDYTGLEWLDKAQTKPTLKEVEQGILDCQVAESDKEQAKIDMKDTTKPVEDRLDAFIKVYQGE